MSRVCPKCNSKTRVENSRYKAQDDYVYRRHECTNTACRERFTTIEIICDDFGTVEMIHKINSRSMAVDIIRARKLCTRLLQILNTEK